MDQVVPWKGLVALIEPYYPKGKGGCPVYPLMAMLRVHRMQNWFGYSDPAMEESLYETTILCQFSGLHLDRIPDETTILNFRRLLEKHELAAGILQVINGYLGDGGLLARGRWSMQRSFMRRVRRRTRTVNVIQKCTRRRKEINISSG
jgi:IS5 family transposase